MDGSDVVAGAEEDGEPVVTAVEARVPSLLGVHVVQMTSLEQITRHLRIESTRILQVRRISGGRPDSHAEEVLRAAIDALLDVRLAWIEEDMASLVDAWAPMPDFRKLLGVRTSACQLEAVFA